VAQLIVRKDTRPEKSRMSATVCRAMPGPLSLMMISLSLTKTRNTGAMLTSLQLSNASSASSLRMTSGN